MSELPPELLAAILAEPDDDAPRLVAADWLDEHGNPEHARLIRLQCRLDADDALSVAERRRLGAEAESLSARLVERASLGLPDDYRVTHVRGFVARVTGRSRLGVAAFGRLAALPLLELISAWELELTPTLLPTLARLPNLRGLAARRLPGQADALLAELARLPRLSTVHSRDGRAARFEALRAEWLAGRPDSERAALGRMSLRGFGERPQLGATLWRYDGRLPPWWPPPADAPGPTHVVAQGAGWYDALPAPSRLPAIASLGLTGAPGLAPDALAGLSGLRELHLSNGGELPDLGEAPELESLSLAGYALAPAALAAALARLPRLRALRLEAPGVDREVLAVIRDRNLREVEVRGYPADAVAAMLALRSPLAVGGGPVTGALPYPPSWTGVPVFALDRTVDATSVWTGRRASAALDNWLTAEVARWPLTDVPGVGSVPTPPALSPVAPFDLPGWEGAEAVACWAEGGVAPHRGPPLSCDRAWVRLARYPDDGGAPRDWLRERIRPLVPRVETLRFFGEARARDAGPMSVRVYWAARREGAVVALAAGAGAGRLFPWRAALAALARRLDELEGRP